MNTSSNQQCVGTCGCCGGRMLQYTFLHMVGPFPSPKCERCGFEYHGPVMGGYKYPKTEYIINEPMTRSKTCLQ